MIRGINFYLTPPVISAGKDVHLSCGSMETLVVKVTTGFGVTNGQRGVGPGNIKEQGRRNACIYDAACGEHRRFRARRDTPDICFSRKSGVLTLNSGGREGRMVFDDGNIVKATSSALTMNVGDVLVRNGLITAGVLEKAKAAQKANGYKETVGAILIRDF